MKRRYISSWAIIVACLLCCAVGLALSDHIDCFGVAQPRFCAE